MIQVWAGVEAETSNPLTFEQPMAAEKEKKRHFIEYTNAIEESE